jgi:dGTPase
VSTNREVTYISNVATILPKKNITEENYKSTEFSRPPFQRDRDRIMYTKAFRRLKGKTQVFLAGYDDHVRNRLTHTLEVSQLATSISSTLKLNLMLTEAIALGHDLGHTPFGHAGERVLNDIMSREGVTSNNIGFKHNWQSIRVVETLETAYRDCPGLSLTEETRWGILHHSSLEYIDCGYAPPYYEFKYSDLAENSHQYWSFEALVVKLADEIAQRHHDFEDGIIAGLIDFKEVLNVFDRTFNKYLDEFNKSRDTNKDYKALLEGEIHKKYFVPLFTKYVIHFYVTKITKLLDKNIKHLQSFFCIRSSNDFFIKKQLIMPHVLGKTYQLFEEDEEFRRFMEDDKEFQRFLRSRILNSQQAQMMDGRSENIINNLFEAQIAGHPHSF